MKTQKRTKKNLRLWGAKGGRKMSKAKLAACRRNAKLGGRPRKEEET